MADKQLEEILHRLGTQAVPDAVHELAEQLGSDFVKDLPPTHKTKTLKLWETIMRSGWTKLAVAALVIVAIALGLGLWDTGSGKVYAAQLLTRAARALGDIESVYIKLKMRTTPSGDNFRHIQLDGEFVTVELWQQQDPNGVTCWRMQNPSRVMVMDGNEVRTLITGKYAYHRQARTNRYNWLPLSLKDVAQIMQREAQWAAQAGGDYVTMHEMGEDGREKKVVLIEAKAQGDFTNDYLKNSGIEESDHQRVYVFDAETSLLEAFHLAIRDGERDVVVLQIQSIQYNQALDSALFKLEWPKDVVFWTEPEVLKDNDVYTNMGPKEAAAAFFQACTDEDWEEFLKYYPQSAVDERTKRVFGKLVVISLGEPFQSGRYPGWFIPYEIKFPNGHIKKHNLAMRNDNAAGRYVFDGGF